MKKILRKVATVLGSALMIGSTIGMAAAANYPAPFVQSGSADVAVVVGAGAALSDALAASNIGNNLATALAAQTASGGTVTSGSASDGDSVKIEKASNKLNLNNSITSVWTAAITKTDLPTLLADGTYMNDENSEYGYTQRIDLGANVNFTHFVDSDYNSGIPSLGFSIVGDTPLLNYTLDWTTNPESDVTTAGGDHLLDIETTDLTLLNKKYYVLIAKNSTGDLTLLDAAKSIIVAEGETKTVELNGENYDVSLSFVSSSSTAKIIVNGYTTSSLGNGGTEKLSDGTYVGVKEVMYTSKDSGVSQVELSLGSGKLELLNGTNIELNDVAIQDVTSIIYKAASSGGKERLDKIVISWQPEDEQFLTPTSELLMPGFGALKFTMADIVFPAEEKTSVTYSGNDRIELRTTIKDGDITLPLLYATAGTGNYAGIGQDSTHKIVTSNATTLFYDAQSGVNEGFIASWNNSRDSETYYLEASVARDATSLVNKTTVKNKKTGASLCTVESGQTCNVGANLVLTATTVEYTNSNSKNVTFTTDTAYGSFNRLYTAEGLTVYLPFLSNDTGVTIKGAINITTNATHVLWMSEENKDGDLGSVNFNVTLGNVSNEKVSVTRLDGAGTEHETASGSNVFESYILTDLATQLLFNRPGGSTPSDVDVIYHGSQVSADVWLAAPGVTVTSGSAGSSGGTATSLGAITVYDNEVSSVSSKNLIVIGGSCINTVAAKLLGSDTPVCEASFTALTNVAAGQYLLQVLDNPYTTGKVAMLVAGYAAGDTDKAAKQLVNTAVDTTVGTKKVFATSTNTEVVQL